MKKTLLLTALCAATLPAHAVDGEILITQAKALAGNVTPGDTPGFPVTLSLPGKYKLAGNLTIADVDTTGVVITNPRVTLDLNGFAIQGPVTTSGTSGATLACGNTSSHWSLGAGIHVILPSDIPPAVHISNGIIAGMGGFGVHSTNGGTSASLTYTLQDMRVAGNGRGGIFYGVEVRDSVSEFNCGHGIYFVTAVRNSTSRNNTGWGIHSSSVLHPRTYGNGAGEMVTTSPIE
ncbi:MAG: right-handed parallel beta-helix repeat-containing protein [Pseudomonadota bacterium]